MTTPFPFFAWRKDSPKRRLLVYYLTHPAAKHYLRELAVLFAVDPANLSRDLKVLETAGIFRSELRGSQKYFSLNRSYHFYEELRSIITKTESGFPQVFAQASHSAYIMAGPNGSGKTTFAKTFLPEYLGCKTFINADLIAAGLAPLAPDQAALRAGRFLLEEIRRTANEKIDFGFETTLSDKSYVHLFRELVNLGYGLHLFFLWIPNVEISLKRIRERVRRGGHDIPEAVVRRRFHRGIQNLFNFYRPFLTSWTIFDNAGAEPKLIVYEERGRRIVQDEAQFSHIQKWAGINEKK